MWFSQTQFVNMATDSVRQIAYQRRRRATTERVTVWVGKDIMRVVDRLRGPTSRQDWMHHAIMLEMVRHLLGRPIPYSGSDLAKAAKLGSEA